jgi:hypothetical protein
MPGSYANPGEYKMTQYRKIGSGISCGSELNAVLLTDEGDTKTPRKSHTEEQILQAIRQVEGGREGRGDLPETGESANRPICLRRYWQRHGARCQFCKCAGLRKKRSAKLCRVPVRGSSEKRVRACFALRAEKRRKLLRTPPW